MRNRLMAILGVSVLAWPAFAQDVDQAALDDAVALGTVATLAPLCGLREEGWSFDLRRATILDATKAPAPDDHALATAPGSDLVTGALSFADAEALESFAEAPPATTCGKLVGSQEMHRADTMVAGFRARKTGS
jgi:hypothetical protein